MRRIAAFTLLTVGLALAGLVLVGCAEEEGDVEKAGKKIDEAAEEVSEAADDAADSLKKAIDQ